MGVLKWSIIIILLYLMLGMLLLRYTDSIAFSEQYPYVILLGATFLLLLPVIVRKYKNLQFSEHKGITIQFIDG